MSTVTTSRPSRRTALRWLGVGTMAIGAVALASALPLGADNEPPAKPAAADAPLTPTELDIRGIPTWWSGREPAP